MGRRAQAHARAGRALAAAAREGRKVQDAEVLEVLRLRGFAKNRALAGVSPAGQGWVHSNNLGLTRSRNGGRFMLAGPTRRYPNVPRLFSRWLQDRRRPSP